MTTQPGTLLRVLLKQRHLRFEAFRAEYDKVADDVAPGDTAPSKAQFYRWLGGELKGGMPYPRACRVLEEMFTPWTAADLFGPYQPDRHGIPSDEQAAPGGLLTTVPASFTADTLQGEWVTCYQFSDPPKVHADIACLTPTSKRHVRIANYPPAPRTQGHTFPFRNEIDAEVVGRHLIGTWKNTNDCRYFGAIHLAVLPGEMVMEGHYTGLTTDTRISAGFWKWVRLAPLDGADLSTVTLRDPADLHALVAKHSQYDAPLPLDAVREDTPTWS